MENLSEHTKGGKRLARIVSILGTAALSGAFVYWLIFAQPKISETIPAAVSLGLFVLGCWRFVPGWMDFWRGAGTPAPASDEPKRVLLLIATVSVAVEAVLYLAVFLVLKLDRGALTPQAYLDFWRCLDSGHYMDIMREWYVFGEQWGCTVQLVFLPGYPLAVYPLYRILGNDVLAGLLVSAAAYPAACCVFYKLLRLDLDHKRAFFAVAFLWLLPGGFFFVAPMSESLYLLLCVSTLYAARKERFVLAGLLGAYAAFTRSLGLLLTVPLLMEWGHAFKRRSASRRILSLLPALLVPVGFLCYLRVNYVVSGNAFQFLVYQREHWGQELGWFFQTAGYQTDLLIQKWFEDKEVFFGLWLPNVLWHFAALSLFALGAKKLRPSYAAWFIAYFLIAIGTTWLLSGPRYLLAMPVIALLLGLLTQKRWQKITAAALLVPASALYLVAFVLRWQVW